MSRPLGKIVWPSDQEEANRLHVRFLISIIETLCPEMVGELYTEIGYAKRFLIGVDIPSEAFPLLDGLWGDLAEKGWLRNVRDLDAVKIRMKIGLLSCIHVGIFDYSESVSWTWEFLFNIGKKNELVSEFIDGYFEFAD